MADDRLDPSPDYQAEAAPIDATKRSPRGQASLIKGLKTLNRLRKHEKELDATIKRMQRALLPLMSKPVLLSYNDERLIAVVSQSRPIKVDVADLRRALVAHYVAEEKVDALDDDARQQAIDEIANKVNTIMSDVCKPPEVDCTEDGLLQQALQDGRIPLEVYAEVAREKPSSAYVQFTRPKQQSDAHVG